MTKVNGCSPWLKNHLFDDCCLLFLTLWMGVSSSRPNCSPKRSKTAQLLRTLHIPHMSSQERKQRKQEPSLFSAGARRPTSAEIVTAARRSLRTLATQRPVTPREEHRQLFGHVSAREARPPSTYSLHSRNFEVPDSRPNSGTRLSPLEHKSRLPLLVDERGPRETAVPKPPPSSNRGNSGRTAPRRLRAVSLPPRPPETHTSKDPHTEGCDDPLSVNTDPSHQWNRRSLHGVETRPPRPPHTHTQPSGTPQVSRDNPPHARGTKPEAEYGREDMTGSDVADVFWDSEVLPVLQEFEAVESGGSVSEETLGRLCQACWALHRALAQRDLLGKRLRRRSVILRALFRLIDLGSDKLNLTLATLVLGLHVSGNNLLNICKLVFRVSCSSSNDFLFMDNSVIDSLLSVLRCEDVSSSVEPVLYMVGSLKLLSGNSDLCALLLSKDVIRVLLQLSHTLTASSVSNAQRVLTGHIQVQLTAALRNLAERSESRTTFLSADVFPTLCAVLGRHPDDHDICLNVARIFSKLSSYAECCCVLAETPSCYRIFLDLLSKHRRKQDLVVRLLFTLGNLAGRSQEARRRVYQEEGSMSVLLGLFQTYKQAGLAPPNPQEPRGPGHRDQDVLVKLIRVLANLSVQPSVGLALASNELCVHLLLEVMEVKCFKENTELVINASATINNLSFYHDQGSVVRAAHTHVSQLLLRLLFSSSMDAVLEAMRVFGNLSQIKDVRHFIIKNKVHHFAMTLLDSKNPDVCFSACGVLLNLSADPENRSLLKEEGSLCRLMDCLRDFGAQDWQLAALVCQTLWNCTEQREEEHTQELVEILTFYSDQDSFPWPCGDDVREYQGACWELEFLPVAYKLKKRLQSQSNSLEEISEPS
ncbi:LOW QUALITY PROTEIN: armadillo repeat-containing protein 2 [Brachyhypopomus gauderio]|uniref:LOW QUALITY PROTEIN: armadillo repeat-containing protein 2 n=1 Tax=Brachyhypopomus gauderio TaxID=698409 RepID=UPI0040417930